MKLRSAGLAIARSIAPLASSRLAQNGLENAVLFFEALQGIGTGAAFSRRELNAIFKPIIGPAPVIFDVGAHAGEFLLSAMKRISAASTFHAFEPSSESFKLLSTRFGNHERVRLNRVALGASAGSGTLFADQLGSQLASLLPRPYFGRILSEQISINVLDDYCSDRQIHRIDLLKLDVEGSELNILKGAKNLLQSRSIHRILFEVGGCNIDSRVFFRDLYELLIARDMRISRLLPGGRFYSLTHYDEMLERFRTTNYLATLDRLTWMDNDV